MHCLLQFIFYSPDMLVCFVCNVVSPLLDSRFRPGKIVHTRCQRSLTTRDLRREVRDLSVVHVPLRNLPRPLQLWLFLYRQY